LHMWYADLPGWKRRVSPRQGLVSDRMRSFARRLDSHASGSGMVELDGSLPL
jgi:hypothetical protein